MQVIINTQKAVYALLSANLEPAIYDFVPDNAILPYITIGDAVLNKKALIGKSLFEIDLRIHAYDQAKGRKNLLEIGQNIFELLDNQFLDVENFEHFETSLISQTVELVDGGEKYFLSADYKIILGEE